MTYEARKNALRNQISELIDQYLDICGEEQGTQFLQASFVLVVACDNIDEDGDVVGSVAIIPKNGSQPNWKILGMLHEAIRLRPELEE